MVDGASLINMGDLSKPATVLIEKISGALGGYFKPYQIKRIAKAEAEAKAIEAQAQIDITDIQRRAFTRWIGEESKKQQNIEEVTNKSIPFLKDSSNPQNMDDDWIMNFFDKCRIISDEQMQTLWAKVLAGEANSQGSYSKRTVNLLSSLDKKDADLFNTLCGFSVMTDRLTPLILDENATIYHTHGLNFKTLYHLDDIGLINYNGLAGFRILGLPQKGIISYRDTRLLINFTKPNDNELEIGKVNFTSTGIELSKVCDSKPLEGFIEFVIQYWTTKKGLTVLPIPS